MIYRLLAFGAIALSPLFLPLTVSAFPLDAEHDAYRSRYRYRDVQQREYRECALNLTEAGVTPEQTAIACAQSTRPLDLSACVARIDAVTPITETSALPACFRVRRPVDLAYCVIEINEDVITPKATDPANVEPLALASLDLCRRSLLPLRFSSCVVGLSKDLPISPEQAMGSCIQAEDLPGQLYDRGGTGG